jgi:hypothetical protein
MIEWIAFTLGFVVLINAASIIILALRMVVLMCWLIIKLGWGCRIHWRLRWHITDDTPTPIPPLTRAEASREVVKELLLEHRHVGQ